MHELFIFQVLHRDLVSALKKKRRSLPMDYFLLHQDNASPHTAESTRQEINLIGFGTVSHPSYSPNLAPMDFSVFLTIKKKLKGRKFKSLSGLRVVVKTIVSQFNEQWYENMFDQWVQRHCRCILHRGEYFEKKWNCVLMPARSGETNDVSDVTVGRMSCSETAKGTSLDERYLFNYMCELFEIYSEKRRKTAVSCHIIFLFLCRKNFLSEQKSTLFLNSPRKWFSDRYLLSIPTCWF